MKKYILIAAAVLMTATACKSNTTRISGQVPEGVDSVVAEVAGETYTFEVSDGKFEGSVPVYVYDISNLKAGGMIQTFVADGSRLSVDFTADEDDQAVSSDKESVQEAYNDIIEWYIEFMEEYDAKARAGEMTAELDEELTKEYVEDLKEFAKENSGNVIGAQSVILLNGQVEDSELEEIIAGLKPELVAANKDVQGIKEGIEKRRGTQAGNMFTDFEVVQPDGTIAKLSDYVGKGKYILVDFWASWCGPCKREIPNIKAAYEKYKGDNFDVLSVAVWDKPEDTVKSAAEHGVVWNQIVNAQRIPTDIYGIEGIPHLILFGPDGTIVKRGEGLRGAGLEETLSKLL